MNSRRHRLFSLFWLILLTAVVMPAYADTTTVHRLEVEGVPSHVIQNNRYLRGSNPEGEQIKNSLTLKLTYTLQHSGRQEEVGAYHGIGTGMLLTSQQMGRPVLAYIVQGAPIINFSRSVSLNYELNLGAAFGWKSYREVDNEDNHVVGSPVTAYIGADVYLRMKLGRHFDLNVGYGYNHFSNANLRMPNEGFNNMGARVSAAYYFNRTDQTARASLFTAETLPKERRWVWDIVAYGGWKKKSLSLPAGFGVAGLSVSPTYRLNSAFAIGPSLDGVYDHSVNLTTSDVNGDGLLEYEYPSRSQQLALGLQARAELTMPLFRASAGFGRYVVGGLSCFYETLAMKVDVTRHFFLNIGYCLYNYNYTNNLMLGIGLRFGT